MLRINNLSFSYDNNLILNDLSFEIKKGEIVALLGINGSGKSTLLKTINRILECRSGSVFLHNKDIISLKRSTIAKHISYVSQHPIDDGLTVFDTIMLGRIPYFNLFP